MVRDRRWAIDVVVEKRGKEERGWSPSRPPLVLALVVESRTVKLPATA